MAGPQGLSTRGGTLRTKLKRKKPKPKKKDFFDRIAAAIVPSAEERLRRTLRKAKGAR